MSAVLSRPRRWFLVLLLAAVAVGGTGGWLFTLANAPAERPGREVTVEIPPGATLISAARLLQQAGVVRSPRFLVFLGKVTGGTASVQAGELAFSTGMTPLEVLRRLIHGHAVLHPVTFPEGYTFRQMAGLLQEKRLADAGRIFALSSSVSFVRSLGVPAPTLEGFLYPDTYAFARGTPEAETLGRMNARFREVFDASMRKQAEERGVGLLAIVTLASMVEKETAVPEERPLVASVFANRLKKGYRLQCDPTVIYGMKDFSGNLTREDLARDHPYNTYTRYGLPPGPICNPGRGSLQAALAPATVPYLYFVARGDGTHVFSSTLAEHNRAVRLYQVKGRGR